MVRAKLQSAILKQVDQSHIRLSKKLIGVEKLSAGKLRIDFEDGYSDDVDLLVGADGIRSVSTRHTNSTSVFIPSGSSLLFIS